VHALWGLCHKDLIHARTREDEREHGDDEDEHLPLEGVRRRDRERANDADDAENTEYAHDANALHNDLDARLESTRHHPHHQRGDDGHKVEQRDKREKVSQRVLRNVQSEAHVAKKVYREEEFEVRHRGGVPRRVRNGDEHDARYEGKDSLRA
jgi:hypothetical protein